MVRKDGEWIGIEEEEAEYVEGEVEWEGQDWVLQTRTTETLPKVKEKWKKGRVTVWVKETAQVMQQDPRRAGHETATGWGPAQQALGVAAA